LLGFAGSTQPANCRFYALLWRQAMEGYLKIPGTRISSVGGQPSGRSCVESPWGQGSYRPTGFAGF
jgi:hypothetical protein